MPIQRMIEDAQLRREGAPGASGRKDVLLAQRQAVLERITELEDCLKILDHKISNYEQVERNAIGPHNSPTLSEQPRLPADGRNSMLTIHHPDHRSSSEARRIPATATTSAGDDAGSGVDQVVTRE